MSPGGKESRIDPEAEGIRPRFVTSRAHAARHDAHGLGESIGPGPGREVFQNRSCGHGGGHRLILPSRAGQRYSSPREASSMVS